LSSLLAPCRPIPAPSVRPWAGARLGPPGASIGELWLAGPGSLVLVEGAEVTLDALAGMHGEALVGSRGMALLGTRFPLLIKVIDAADRLSLQVHPDDSLARRLYGAGALGKAEAWLVLESEPGAELITGPAPGVDGPALLAAVASGTADVEHCRRTPAVPGDTWLLRPGTLHAIGAGTFVYEIEQPSDLTFRISDWGRQTGRALHVAEALQALQPTQDAILCGTRFRLDGGALETPHFRLELPDLAHVVPRRPAGRTCEVVTCTRGTLHLDGGDWQERLEPLETIVVPAAVPSYTIRGSDGALACVGSIP
jgi:mannose-6-phosphate isomerase